jgi:cell division septation protein DedD
VLLLLLLPALPWAQQKEEPEELLRRAEALASAGESGPAAAAYRAWLRDNAETEGAGRVLLAAVESCSEADDALRLLADFASKLRDAETREACLQLQADLLQLVGRPEEALAVQLSLPETPRRLVERGVLYLELGLTAEAEQVLQKARQGAAAGPAARYLLATLYLATGRGEQGEAELRLLADGQPAPAEAPAALLALGEALRARGEEQAAGMVSRELQARFPASPEAALALRAAGVRRAAVPLRLLPGELASAARLPESEQPAAATAAARPTAAPKALVQAGSFRDPDNARYLVRDLAARGFSARVMELGEPRFFRVVVGPEQSLELAQELLLRLKDAGYEGVLLLQ